MANKHGDFIWYELMTTDADAARTFYSDLVGWDIEAGASGPMDYRMISAADGPVAGLMPLSEEMTCNGARPMWAGYVGVDDVDAAVSAITEHGGTVLLPAQDIPDVGRFAFASDPAGAPFYVMRGAVEGGESTSFAKYEPRSGHCAWNELATSDPAGAKSFYGRIFGWVKDGEMDMGPMGTYEFLRQDDYGIGAVMPKMPQMPVSAWTHYFRVADIDVAAAKVSQGGGTLIQEPIEIPGGDYSLVAVDPQGASFGLVGPRKG